MVEVIAFALLIPVTGLLADTYGRRKNMIGVTCGMLAVPVPVRVSSQPLVMLSLVRVLVGLTFGPMCALLPGTIPH